MNWKIEEDCLTAHARARCQQRGIRAEAIEAALAFGEMFHDRNSSVTYWLSRRCVEWAWRLSRQDLEPFQGAAITFSQEGDIITAQWAPRRKRQWGGGR